MIDLCNVCPAASHCKYCMSEAFDACADEDYCDVLIDKMVERGRKEYADAWRIYASQYDDEA